MGGAQLLMFPHSHGLAGVPGRFATKLFWLKQYREVMYSLCQFLVCTVGELTLGSYVSALEGERGEGAAGLVSLSPFLACRVEGLFSVSLGRTERSPEACTRAGIKAALDKPCFLLKSIPVQTGPRYCAPQRDVQGVGKRLNLFSSLETKWL